MPPVGFVVVIGCVLAGYLMHHGVLAVLWQPNEVIIICGAAFGAFLMANPMSLIKETFSQLPKIFTGKEYKKEQYVDVLLLMFEFLSIARREGMLALEEHANKPDSSAIFSKYPSILKNHLKDFLADNLKVFVSGNIEPHEFKNLMDIDTEVHEHHGSLVPGALNTVSDSLPGLGIVAAVLGIVTTMGLMKEPPEVLGASVGAALCGTFLGLLLSYGYMAPMAKALENQANDFNNILKVATKSVLAAFTKGMPPILAIEFARRAIPTNCRPGYEELEELLKSVKK